MSGEPPEGDAALSWARLSGLAAFLRCDRQMLQEAVRRLGPLELATDPQCLPGQHSLCLEMWDITDGGVFFGKFDQYQWAEAAGFLWGGALGAVWGYRYAGSVVAPHARAVSRAASGALTRYREMFLAVPYAFVAGHESRMHSVVLGMVTDSALARWADVALGFGYGKRAGVLRSESNQDWTVASHTGSPIAATAGGQDFPPQSDALIAQLDNVWQFPLIGCRGRGELARSWLLRSVLQGRPRSIATTVSIDATAMRSFGLEVGGAPQPPGPCAAVEFSDVDARLSYPGAV